MGLEGAVRLGMRRELEAIADPAERDAAFEHAVAAAYERGKGLNMAAYFEIDDVIDPADSARWIATLFDGPDAAARRASAAPTSTPGSAVERGDSRLRTGWRTRAGVTTRGRRRSPAAGFGESVRKRRGALSSRPPAYAPTRQFSVSDQGTGRRLA